MDVTGWSLSKDQMKCRACWYFSSDTVECHRHAPSQGGFPIVGSNDWCGDFVLDVARTLTENTENDEMREGTPSPAKPIVPQGLG